MVPGNHDHWKGKGFYSSPAFNPRLYARHFRRTPWLKRWSSGPVCLELMGLDSNSGLDKSNRRARGSIDAAQFRKLREKIGKQPAVAEGVTLVRAVVVHHSLAYVAPLGSGFNMMLDDTRDALLAFAGEHRCAAILTGHTHDFHHEPFQAPTDGLPHIVTELRCSTTLQGPVKADKQGFFLHRLSVRDDAWYWEVWKYVWGGGAFLRGHDKPDWTMP